MKQIHLNNKKKAIWKIFNPILIKKHIKIFNNIINLKKILYNYIRMYKIYNIVNINNVIKNTKIKMKSKMV